MNLLERNLAAALLILAVVLFRVVFLKKLPKSTFRFLWGIILLRLFLPFTPVLPFPVPFPALPEMAWEEKESLPSKGSALMAGETGEREKTGTGEIEGALPSEISVPQPDGLPEGSSAEVRALGGTLAGPEFPGLVREETLSASGEVLPSPAETISSPVQELSNPVRPLPSFFRILYAAGAVLTGGFFLFAYGVGRRRFRDSEPVPEEWITVWKKKHPLRRPLSVRSLKGLLSPITYGALSPVILVPGGKAWWGSSGIRYELEHEYVHVLHFDACFKYLLALAVSLNWFNPAVWLLYLYSNRDIEMSCDETVLRRLGEEERGAYATALLDAEERRGKLAGLYASFRANATKERIIGIMTFKRNNVAGLALAGLLVISLGACAVAAGSSSQNQGGSAVTTEKGSGENGGNAAAQESTESNAAAESKDAMEMKESPAETMVQESEKTGESGMMQETAASEKETTMMEMEEPADFQEETAGEGSRSFSYVENEGIRLPIPEEYADLVVVELPKTEEDDFLFMVCEKASREAAERKGTMDGPWVGELFAIMKMSAEEMEVTRESEIPGYYFFARDAYDNYYTLYLPSECYIERDDLSPMRDNIPEVEGFDQWEMLSDWAATCTSDIQAANVGVLDAMQ